MAYYHRLGNPHSPKRHYAFRSNPTELFIRKNGRVSKRIAQESTPPCDHIYNPNRVKGNRTAKAFWLVKSQEAHGLWIRTHLQPSELGNSRLKITSVLADPKYDTLMLMMGILYSKQATEGDLLLKESGTEMEAQLLHSRTARAV